MYAGVHRLSHASAGPLVSARNAAQGVALLAVWGEPAKQAQGVPTNTAHTLSNTHGIGSACRPCYVTWWPWVRMPLCELVSGMGALVTGGVVSGVLPHVDCHHGRCGLAVRVNTEHGEKFRSTSPVPTPPTIHPCTFSSSLHAIRFFC